MFYYKGIAQQNFIWKKNYLKSPSDQIRMDRKW